MAQDMAETVRGAETVGEQGAPMVQGADVRARILARAAAVRAAAEALDVSATRSVRMGDLRVGDVVLSVGPKTFPFPFTLTDVKVLRGVVILRASHGWTNLTPYPAQDKAEIIAR